MTNETTEQLGASFQTTDSILKAEYWNKICPGLTIEKHSTSNGQIQIKCNEKAVENARNRIIQDGYTVVDCNSLSWGPEEESIIQNVQNAAKLIVDQGWPPSFLMVFDQIWQLVSHAEKFMSEATGNLCNYDMLAWYIDPSKGDSGFSPHRDRQPDDAKSTFRTDGSPKYSTCWIAFTDANPDNSCLHFIPAKDDPGYMEGDLEGVNDPDPLQRSLPDKESFQKIKAAPVEKGGAVIFTHRVIHWGSQGRKGYDIPRVSMSFGCADDEFEKSYLDRKFLPYPPFELRVALVCAQMISYYQRFPPSVQQLQIYYQIFDRFKDRFDEKYRQRIAYEYVKACDEMHCSDKEDLLDGALQTMLQTGGDGYQDDFDSLDENDEQGNGVMMNNNANNNLAAEEEEEDDEETIANLKLTEEEFVQLLGRPPKRAKTQK
eukprot:TRINITY_DN12249_c0_g2_i1.p1 TRINITY_DN12249_c0_g2~~TRINITY_DN12249_c0_g2_i1.p1  ORF type:complete len:431 (+),score=84.77 TRINITY_DN12249_c0_g2_i1:103-1395(+)